MITRLREFYGKHHRWISIVFFLLGFLFDTVMLQRIDEPKVILQQALYLLICAFLIGIELIEGSREVPPPRFLARVWIYREPLLSFLLGTLLNSHAIFYFKSASALTSLAFIAVLIALLTINEFKHFEESQVQVHMALLSLCLVSWLVGLAPIVMGYIGAIPFLFAILASISISLAYYFLLRSRLPEHLGMLLARLALPFTIVHVLFVILYFAHVIPPVPLSTSYIGIFHDVKKADGAYELTYTRPAWKFWQHGDQTFLARPGDTLFCFARIFSPTRFSDQLQVRWLLWDKKQGWLSADAIPMAITGGREGGYRAMDSRELGRINFEVVPDTALGERELKMMLQ
jgi:hypothetical protein